jgi:methenyltetrahydromethanopterin cyclohydrolase
MSYAQLWQAMTPGIDMGEGATVTVVTTLNERAQRLADHMAANAALQRIEVQQTAAGARIIDCGVKTEGGLQAGLGLARVCLSGLADVTLFPGGVGDLPAPLVQVMTDAPVLACMGSQYAGWQVALGKYFAMASGPIRAAYGKEELYDQLPGREKAPVAVGVLETRKLPGDDVIAYLAEKLEMPPTKLTLLTAPAFSLAGNLQVVARALETALHKLHELKFDLSQVVSGIGVAPLPPVGRTNDAILYGGQATLWVKADDEQLREIGPKVPSSASPDHGAPFADIFNRYEMDFYKIDPLLFSPAMITFNNLRTGRSHVFGRLEVDVLKRSFFGAAEKS